MAVSYIAIIWANHIIAGNRLFSSITNKARREEVREELVKRVKLGELLEEEYEKLVKEKYISN